MRNGSDVDARLKARGGWIGTDDELKKFCDDHIFDNNFHQAPSTPWSFYWASTVLQVQRTAEALRMLVLASDAKAAFEKERATWRFDDPADDVYGFRDGMKRDVWATMDAKAVPLGREAALGFQEQGLADMEAQARQVWKDGYEPGRGAVSDMLGLWARGKPLKGNGIAAENLASEYAAFHDGTGPAKPGFDAIKALIEAESDPKPPS
jgi:hypothetical protein